MTNRQIEAARITMMRHVKRGGKAWINTPPNRPLMERSTETRMGFDKGTVERWVAPAKPDRILFELGGIGENLAREATRRA